MSHATELYKAAGEVMRVLNEYPDECPLCGVTSGEHDIAYVCAALDKALSEYKEPTPLSPEVYDRMRRTLEREEDSQ